MTVQAETDANPPPRPHWLQVVAVGRNPQRTFIRIAVLVVFCVIFFHFVVLPARVDGISMAPTYKNRSINLINQLAYVWHEPRRGDVVAVRAWAGKHLMVMKRIIGLPGETVSFQDGRVFINGKRLEEPYEKWRCNWTLPPVKLGPQEYFIVGDNRTMPWRDHYFGKVNRDRIVGKMLL
ncbi:MAG TPA: signal peptidase I [Verrucomicrobiae bacterium]|nr:signal peptidase I [Verrucomicrobiae bacterium]